MGNEKPATKLCKHCKTEIASDAKVCPNCRKKQGMSGCLVIILAIVVLGVLGSLLGSGDSKKNDGGANNNEPQQTQTSGTDKDSDAKEASESVTPATKYKASTYKVGADIPAGEYVLFSDSSLISYFEVSSDSNGDLDSILANGNFSTNAILTVTDGQYFKMQGCYAIPIEEVTEVNTDKDGTFKIGTFLSAGEYKLAVDENSVLGSGYYEVASNSDGNLNSIITNGNFEGETYITVSDGQYLKLVGSHIVK